MYIQNNWCIGPIQPNVIEPFGPNYMSAMYETYETMASGVEGLRNNMNIMPTNNVYYGGGLVDQHKYYACKLWLLGGGFKQQQESKNLTGFGEVDQEQIALH